jgi:SAM-dependent methyltransferase
MSHTKPDLLDTWVYKSFPPLLGTLKDKFGFEIPLKWVDTSRQLHSHIFPSIQGRPYDAESGRVADVYNASDYFYQNLLGPSKKVLDFGAGYGRQSFLWTHLQRDVTYYAIDAVEGSYILQRKVFESLPEIVLHDYIDSPKNFKILNETFSDQSRIYHLPSWRLDLIPDQSLDLIMAVQVLQEIPGDFVGPVLREFSRMIKPGGKLYIRDHENWEPSHSIKIRDVLETQGWWLSFVHPGLDEKDIHGIPRIWFKI